MYESSINTILNELLKELRYHYVRRVRVNPNFYQAFLGTINQVEVEKEEVIDIVEDPAVETYIIE